MKIAICDDNIDFINTLSKLIKDYFFDKQLDVDLCTFHSGEELLNEEEIFDIVFLDVEMGSINGIQVAEALKKRNSHTVIFIVTAHNQYLDVAMDLNVFRYLDKPIVENRLYKGLDKALEFINSEVLTIVSEDKGIFKVALNEIMYIEVYRRNTKIVTTKETITTKLPLKYFKDKMTDLSFVIPHNSYIVNLNFVDRFERMSLTMRDGKVISIAQKKQPEIKRRFFSFIGEV